MEVVWLERNLVGSIVSTVLIVALGAFLFFILCKSVKRKLPYILFVISYGLILVSFIFCLDAVLYISVGMLTALLALTLFANLGDLRRFIANPFKVTKATVVNQNKVEKIFDRDAFNKEIEKTVITLSKAKIGAIITFERNNSLNDIVKNGVPVNAPVSAELLSTIFYPGTRLHDGAVVIHGNEIIAASVFFTPTTKAFAGKYGSRHRAAIGISEISDAVTVVVSEETGRISFAVNGTLETVDQSSFLRVFDNLLRGTASKK